MEGWVVGVSGGIDSAVTSTLCALTAPTVCVEMPIHQAPEQVSRASKHIESLCARHPRVRRSTVSLTEVYDTFAKALPDGPDESRGLAMANSCALAHDHALRVGPTGEVLGGWHRQQSGRLWGGFLHQVRGRRRGPFAHRRLEQTESSRWQPTLASSKRSSRPRPPTALWGDDRTDEDQLGATYPESGMGHGVGIPGRSETRKPGCLGGSRSLGHLPAFPPCQQAQDGTHSCLRRAGRRSVQGLTPSSVTTSSVSHSRRMRASRSSTFSVTW